MRLRHRAKCRLGGAKKIKWREADVWICDKPKTMNIWADLHLTETYGRLGTFAVWYFRLFKTNHSTENLSANFFSPHIKIQFSYLTADTGVSVTYKDRRVNCVSGNNRCLSEYDIHKYLTYSMEQSPSWEANRFSASQEIPRILRTRRFITAFTSARQLSLSWTTETTSHFLNIQLNIILSSTPWSSKWSLSLRFLHQNPIHTSTLPHTCYMPRQSHPSRFDYSKKYWARGRDY
jgi:hypothetical protein